MANENDEIHGYVKHLIKINSDLEAKIKQLEDKIDSQNIIIDALVGKAKASKSDSCSALNEKFSDVKKFKENTKVESHLVKDPFAEDASQEFGANVDIFSFNNEVKSEPFSRNEDIPGHSEPKSLKKTDGLYYDKDKFIKQVKSVFIPKNKSIEFKANYTFSRFFEFTEASYEFSLLNKKINKSKNPLKLYIETNLEKILKYLFDNLNKMTLNQICSTVFVINSEIDYKTKLVLSHDFLIEIDNFSKLPYIYSALFNNLKLEDDNFSRIIKTIIHQQYSIDANFFQNSEISDFLINIKDNFSLSGRSQGIWENLDNFELSMPVFFKPVDSMVIKPDIIEKSFILRMMCHYVDWDYTYNKFILSKIYPMIIQGKSASALFFLGILTMNAQRIFGRNQGVQDIFDEIKGLMKDSSDISIVSYLILKPFFEGDATSWLEKYQNEIEERGFSTNYIKSLLIL